MTEKGRVVVERINMVKRHTKPTQRSPQGGILEKEGSVEVVERRALVRQVRRAAPRHARRGQRRQKKRRVCVKCGTVFESDVRGIGIMAQDNEDEKKAAGKAGRPELTPEQEAETAAKKAARAEAKAKGGKVRQGQGLPAAAKEVATERVKRDRAAAPAHALRQPRSARS